MQRVLLSCGNYLYTSCLWKTPMVEAMYSTYVDDEAQKGKNDDSEVGSRHGYQ